jgi:hypothetical protein
MANVFESGRFAFSEPVNAGDVLDGKVNPVANLAVAGRLDGSVTAQVEWRTEGPDALRSVGTARRTNGESYDELQFSAATDAASLGEELNYLATVHTLEGVNVRFFDKSGTVFEASGKSSTDALRAGLGAFLTK